MNGVWAILFFLGCVGLPAAPAERLPQEINVPVTLEKFTLATNVTLIPDLFADRLRISWAHSGVTNGLADLLVSMEPFGHWKSRAWRALPMVCVGEMWQAFVPVSNPDEPCLYFLSRPAARSRSPAFVCLPRETGLDHPTQLRTAFLEGFEEGMLNWMPMNGGDGKGIEIDGRARTGQGCLRVELRAGQRMVDVGSRILRGSRLAEQRALGMSFWAKSTVAEARVRISLMTEASTPLQETKVLRREPAIPGEWTEVRVLWSEFPTLLSSGIDFFLLELLGNGPADFFLDDFQLIEATGRFGG